MNERIKLLALQADEFTKQADELLQKETSRGFRLAEWQETFREKFAELLIRECWTTISPFIEDDNLAEDALAELKEQFGVEE